MRVKIAHVGTGGIVYESDRRLKQNIQYDLTAKDPYETFKKFKMCTYDWKATDTVEEVLGVIAQDLQDEPELASYVIDTGPTPGMADQTSYLSVDYNALFLHTMAVVQQLQTKCEALEARVASLES